MVHYKPSDRYLHELLYPDLQQGWEQHNRRGLLAEGHARIATPLYNIAFMAMALSAIIGGGFSRLGYARRIATFCAIAAVVRILGFVAQSASEANAWLNILQYAIPLATTAVALRGIFRQRAARSMTSSIVPAMCRVKARYRIATSAAKSPLRGVPAAKTRPHGARSRASGSVRNRRRFIQIWT